MNELKAWAEQAEVGDTQVDLNKSWQGIHSLLTGSAEPNGTVASKVIMGGDNTVHHSQQPLVSHHGAHPWSRRNVRTLPPDTLSNMRLKRASRSA